MAAKVLSVIKQPDGKYKVTYADQSTSILPASQAQALAKNAGIKLGAAASTGIQKPADVAAPATNTGALGFPTGFKTTNNQDAFAVSDTSSGVVLPGNLSVTINGTVYPLASAILQANDLKKLSTIRDNLLATGQISKTDAKDNKAVAKRWQEVLIGAATGAAPNTSPDIGAYLSALKSAGFTQTSTGTATSGTITYPSISSATDAQATITKLFQDRLGRKPTNQEVTDFTKILNAEEVKSPKKVTYSPTGQKTTGGFDAVQFLTNEMDKQKPLKAEADAVLNQAPDVTARLADKKIYDNLIAAAGNDFSKIKTAKETTAYGRGLADLEAALQAKVLESGATNSPEEINALAQSLYDKGIDPKTATGASQIESALKYGADSVTGKYKGTAATTVADLQATAIANGLDLNTNFGDKIPGWISAINSGEQVDNIKQQIRDVAKLGQPDSVKKLIDNGIDLSTIYDPYKKIMASTLEINPATITMTDPTLRAAITPTGEQSLYDYQKALRKDTRWQYTQQANSEVADATQKILQDFGFMG